MSAPVGNSMFGYEPASAYAQWTFGRGSTSLPRDPRTFLSGAFGPLDAIAPMAIDVGRDETGRPEPRRWQYPVGWNLPVGIPGSEGLQIASFASLRRYADVYSLLRACIELRKSELVAAGWDIGATGEAEKAARGDKGAQKDIAERSAKIRAFFHRPDPAYNGWDEWFSALLEDIFVLDAGALYLHPTRVAGKGPFGTSLAALDLLDGSTIRPLLDVRGGRPLPPNPAYQQYLWGIPRSDLMAPITDRDDLGEADAEYAGDQIVYLRSNPRAWTPYGYSLVSQSLLPVAIGLKRQEYWLDYFNEGSVPAVYIDPGPSVSTPAQIRQLQDILNAIAGDVGYKHKVIVLPPGSKSEPQKQPVLDDKIDITIAEQVLQVFRIQMMELSMMPGGRTSSMGSNAAAQAGQEAAAQQRTRPMRQWLKRTLFDYVIHFVLGQHDLEWQWIDDQPSEDELSSAQAAHQRVATGITSIDEERLEAGKDPWGLPITGSPGVLLPTGYVTLDPDVQREQAELESEIAAENAPPEPAHPAVPLPPGEPGTPPPEHAAHAPVTPTAPNPDEAEPKAGAEPTKPGGAKSAERDALRNYLRHGKPLEKFVALHLTPAEVALIAAPFVGKALRSGTRRKAAVDPIAARVAAALGAAAAAHRRDKLSSIAFVDTARRALTAGYADAYSAGYADSGATGTADATAVAEQRAAAQEGFLHGLLQDLAAGMSAAAIASRMGLYGASVNPVYEQGFGDGVAKQGDYTITWIAEGDKDTCELCDARDGQTYTRADLPGYPGDGGFGGLCEGGVNCRCQLDYTPTEG